MISFIDEFYELTDVLCWGAAEGEQTLKSKDLIKQQLLTRTSDDQACVLCIGTRKFGDCTRQLLLDRLTVLRIRSHILANDLAAAPLPELSARPSSQYSNVALVEPDSVDRLKAKEWSLKLNNYGRARRAAVREDWLDAARQAVCAEDGGSILAISAVAFEQGKKRRRVLEVGWALWTKGTPTTHIKVTHIKVKDWDRLRNGKVIPDRRDAFAHGNSLVRTLEKTCELFHKECDALSAKGPLTIIGVDTHKNPSAILLRDVDAFVMDLPKLFKSARKDQGLKASLKDVLLWYGIKHDEKRIGNAGNDAKYTLEAFQKLGMVQ